MNTIIKLTVLVLVVIGLSACGRMGELEPVKAEKVAIKVSETVQVSIV